MANDAEKAARLKEDGNKHFGIGNHAIAESLYSKASVCILEQHLDGGRPKPRV
jgi:hypothetical protein